VPSPRDSPDFLGDPVVVQIHLRVGFFRTAVIEQVELVEVAHSARNADAVPTPRFGDAQQMPVRVRRPVCGARVRGLARIVRDGLLEFEQVGFVDGRFLVFGFFGHGTILRFWWCLGVVDSVRAAEEGRLRAPDFDDGIADSFFLGVFDLETVGAMRRILRPRHQFEAHAFFCRSNRTCAVEAHERAFRGENDKCGSHKFSIDENLEIRTACPVRQIDKHKNLVLAHADNPTLVIELPRSQQQHPGDGAAEPSAKKVARAKHM